MNETKHSQFTINTPTKMTAAGIVGFVVGCVALLTSFLPIVNNISFIFALIGTVFALVGVIATVRGKRKGKGFAIAALLICILSGIIVLATQSYYGAVIDETFGTTESITESTATETAKAADADAPNYKVTIDSSKEAKDYSGENAIIVTYTFTNNSDEDASFYTAILAQCFQNGTQLDTTYIDGIDVDKTLNELKPGATITVQEAYLLDDKSDVMVECTEILDFSEKIIAEKTFTLN